MSVFNLTAEAIGEGFWVLLRPPEIFLFHYDWSIHIAVNQLFIWHSGNLPFKTKANLVFSQVKIPNFTVTAVWWTYVGLALPEHKGYTAEGTPSETSWHTVSARKKLARLSCAGSSGKGAKRFEVWEFPANKQTEKEEGGRNSYSTAAEENLVEESWWDSKKLEMIFSNTHHIPSLNSWSIRIKEISSFPSPQWKMMPWQILSC